jgi:hypothetical protein
MLLTTDRPPVPRNDFDDIRITDVTVNHLPVMPNAPTLNLDGAR